MSEKDSLRGSPTQDGHEPKAPLLACPFYKRDMHTYGDCVQYKLRRIKDVKQHIYRKHLQPAFYCPRCYVSFAQADTRDSHIRKAACTILQGPNFDGISETQRALLKSNASRGNSVEDQWRGIWNIIFPGEHGPLSIYQGSIPELSIEFLQQAWASTGPEIMTQVVAECAEARSLSYDLVNSFMTRVFQHFSENLDRTQRSSNGVAGSSPRAGELRAEPISDAVSEASTIHVAPALRVPDILGPLEPEESTYDPMPDVVAGEHEGFGTFIPYSEDSHPCNMENVEFFGGAWPSPVQRDSLFSWQTREV